MPDLKQSLRDFIATSNSGKYKSEDELLSKFPELKSYDKQSLRDFVATSNSGKYKTEDELLSKFPEFGIVKKKTLLQRLRDYFRNKKI
jgi:tRNA threonylcarbamoyladenosine modification (KEOPS) complex Cgi121 subunit